MLYCKLFKKIWKYNDIRILDSNTENIYENLKSTDIVGISSVTQDFERAKRFARFVKEQLDVPVIIGGVHISTLPKLPEPFDVGVIGEGEQTMLELMEVQEFSVKHLKKIKGVCYRENNITKITQSRELIDQLDSVPIPNRSLVNMGHYLKNNVLSRIIGVGV